MKRTLKDWAKVIVLFLDEAAVVVIVIAALHFFRVEIPLPLAIALALILGAIVFIIHVAVIPSFHRKQVTGQEGMIGQHGRVVEALTPMGTVMVNGERWRAKPVDNSIIDSGDNVEVVKIEGLTLKVERFKR
ncbi:NfeD family protein [Chloroflexota bacterium]